MTGYVVVVLAALLSAVVAADEKPANRYWYPEVYPYYHYPYYHPWGYHPWGYHPLDYWGYSARGGNSQAHGDQGYSSNPTPGANGVVPANAYGVPNQVQAMPGGAAYDASGAQGNPVGVQGISAGYGPPGMMPKRARRSEYPGQAPMLNTPERNLEYEGYNPYDGNSNGAFRYFGGSDSPASVQETEQ